MGHLKRELHLARKENHASKLRMNDVEVLLEEALRTNPGTDLRRKIKRLCIKYHPDRGVTNVSSTA